MLETQKAPSNAAQGPKVGSERADGPNDDWGDLDVTRDLKARTIRGGAATMLGQALKLVLTVASTAVLARLLPPEDFGLMGMVSVVIGFLMAVGDMGISMVIVQRAGLLRAQVDKLFWFGLTLQLVLAGVTAAAAPAIGALFGEPAVVVMTIVMAGGFVIAGLGMTHMALMRRQMRFVTVTCIEIGALVGGIALGIVAAAAGYGAWSLVVLYLGHRGLETLGAWLASSWRPRLPRREVTIGPLLRFGGYHSGFAFVNYFARNSDNLLIGWFWGAGPLGLYSKAYSLLMMPIVQLNVPISGVTLPALSRLQNEPERFRRAYLRAVELLATLGLPLVTFTIVAAEDIVLVLLGEQWTAVIAIFRILGLVGLAQLITNTAGMLFVATGRTDRMFRLGVWTTIATLATFALALPHGIERLTLCYAAYTWASAVPILWMATRGTSITVNDIFRCIARPAACAMALACGLLGVAALLTSLGPLSRLTMLGVASTAIWFTLVVKATPDLNPLRLFAEMRRQKS